MWRKIFKSTDWSTLVELVSPETFEVMPLGNAGQQFTELATNLLKKKRFLQALRNRERLLDRSKLQVRLLDPDDALTGEPTSTQASGQRLLELYFHQLYFGPSTILDLRHSRFRQTPDGLIWQPNRFLITWQPEFITAIRSLYAGFYTDDDATFRSALQQLHIDVAEDQFRDHFGAGRQQSVTFELTHFRETFQDVFCRCKEAGVELSANFIGLGFYLSTLYEHLETLGGEFDVRNAFFSVYQQDQNDSQPHRK